jgi:hypothetical protein
MPGPLFSVLTAIPWSAILKNAPAIVKAANALLTGTREKPQQLSTADELASLKTRVENLETRDRDDAELLKKLADQLEILTFSTRIVAGRVKLALWLAGAGLLAAVAAIVLGRI